MRDELAQRIKSLILGPLNGDDEKLSFRPLNLYSTGILYPQVSFTGCQATNSDSEDPHPDSEEGQDESENEKNSKETNYPYKEDKDDDERDEEDDELKLATNFSPSSMGFSFIVGDRAAFSLFYKFGRYMKIKDKESDFRWERKHYEQEIKCKLENGELFIDGKQNSDKIIVDESNYKVKLNFFTRNANVGDTSTKLITISLINSGNEGRNDEHCVFQPQLKVQSPNPVFIFFQDKTDYDKLKDETESLNSALLYREYKVYAMGHGVSVNWAEDSTQKKCTEITTEVMPEELIYGVDFDVPGDSAILEMKGLAGPTFNPALKDENLKSSLLSFANRYNEWIERQTKALEKLDINKNIKDQGKRNLEACEKLHERITKGVDLIFSKPKIKQAFFDANKAMFMQRVMGAFANWRREKGNVVPGTEGYKSAPMPEFDKLPSGGRVGTDDEFGFYAKWRPFQLAFILSQIEGITNTDSKDRDTTDLIWFPTGGGKTEAYLGLIAFTLFYRRLREKNPDNGAGVSIMMRYTLRMLNLDQFQRANLLIAACEMIRYNNSKDYGLTRFSSGIWVGRSLTPNKYKDEQDGVDYGYNSNLKNYCDNIELGSAKKVIYSPHLLNCPCCGNRLVKERKGNSPVGNWGYFRTFVKGDGFEPTGKFIVSCTNSECHFYTVKDTTDKNFNENKLFPFYTVDEEIYTQRPSLLFGTVDKYAQISWRRDSAKLFNLDIENNNNQLFPGPELIIQDELHLIGSSLGTIYGLFEYAIDKLCSLKGIKPKIVGATATVKNAEQQCKRLYNRKYFAQFPPPGISADDSFYMKKNDKDAKPRKYVGFMPSGFTSSTSIIRLSSILMEAPNVFDISNEQLDKYYTLLVYFNSLKELGKFRTFIDDDIFAYRKFLASQVLNKIHQNYSGRDIELSSAMSADDITLALEKLKKFRLISEILQDDKLKEIRKIGIRCNLDWAETTRKKEILSQSFFEALGLEYTEEYEERKDRFLEFLKKYYKESNTNPEKIATATNMIATGVDITRLNVMLINGHPKSSSEYIQASSRVGREDAGLIFSFYSATKNRDRSHYENYKSFHQAFYKLVEPASVTPHSQPALEKIVPSIIIALTWIIHRKSSKDFFEFDANISAFIDEIAQEITARLGNGVNEYLGDIINGIKEKWRKLNPSSRRFAHFGDYMQYALKTIGEGEVLDVSAEYAPLAVHLIPKVSTMRDVEANCNVKILKNG